VIADLGVRVFKSAYFLGQVGKTLYSLISYGGGSNFGGPYSTLKCSSPTFNPEQFCSIINQIQPSGGGQDDQTLCADALSVALTVATNNSNINAENKFIGIV